MASGNSTTRTAFPFRRSTLLEPSLPHAGSMWVRQKIEKELSHAAPQFPPLHRRTSLAEAAAPTPDAAVAPPQSAMSSPRCLFNILTSRRCLRKTTGTGKRHRRSAVLFNILACRSGRHRRLRRWQRRAAPRARRRRRSPPTPRSRASRRRRPGGQAAGQLPDALAAASSEVINGAVQGGYAGG